MRKMILRLTIGMFSCLILWGCDNHLSPNTLIDTYARGVVDFDLKSSLSCFEGGKEIVCQDKTILSNLEYSTHVFQEMQAYGLGPRLDYNIVKEKVCEFSGIYEIEFVVEVINGENEGVRTFTQSIPIYKYNGKWWIGEKHPEDLIQVFDNIKIITDLYGVL